jgi:hypothetical protein
VSGDVIVIVAAALSVMDAADVMLVDTALERSRSPPDSTLRSSPDPMISPSVAVAWLTCSRTPVPVMLFDSPKTPFQPVEIVACGLPRSVAAPSARRDVGDGGPEGVRDRQHLATGRERLSVDVGLDPAVSTRQPC